MSETGRLRRARVVRIYDTLDTMVLLGPDGRAHQLRAETAQLAKVLLFFLLEARTLEQIIEHVEAVSGAKLGEDSVVHQLLDLLQSAGAFQSLLQGHSSIGRASVSKTEGWGFETLCPCQQNLRRD